MSDEASEVESNTENTLCSSYSDTYTPCPNQHQYEEVNSSFVEHPSLTQPDNSTVSCSVTADADKGVVCPFGAMNQSGDGAMQQLTETSLSTLVDSDFEEACVITTSLLKKLSDHRLLTPASKESDHLLEEIKTTLLQIARRCRKDVKFTSHAATCFARNTELLRALVAMLNGFFQETEVSYQAASCTALTHEVLGMLTDESKALLVQAAKFGFVFVMLFELQCLTGNRKYTEIVKLVVTAVFGLIQNFASEPSVWLYFSGTKFIDILSKYLGGQDKGVHLMCVLTLAFLVEIMDHQEQQILVLKPDEIQSYIEVLCDASSEEDLTARKVYGSLVVPADDMLKLLKNLWQVEANQSVIKDQLPFILMSIELCVTNGKDDSKHAALDLLWTLTSGMSAGDLHVPDRLLTTIKTLLIGSDTSISSMAHCVLHALQPSNVADLLALKSLSDGSYRHRRYTECIQWSEKLMEAAKKSSNSPAEIAAIALHGKSYFHLYRKEQQLLQETSTSSPKEYHLQRQSVHIKMKKAISALSAVEDATQSSHDHDAEVSRFLDITMVDCACLMNGLKEVARCLLCQKKAKLLRSHLCPESILRAFASGLGKTRNQRVFNLSFFQEGDKRSPHMISKWLFCEKCEHILNKDGEVHFLPMFFNKIYNTSNPTQPMEEMHIRYDEWLYRFALGILFRGLVNEAINSFMNSEEIYSTFAMCRKLLLNQGSLQTVHKPVVHLLVSPVKPETNAGFIGHVHNAPFLFALTNRDLKTGLKEIPRVAHFFLARIGILNFLLLFECADKTIMPEESVLHTGQSSFRVPPDHERTTPQGIVQILEDLAVTTQKNFLETTTTLAKGMSLNQTEVPQDSEKETFHILPGVEDDAYRLEGFVPTNISLDNPQELNLLPKGMVVNHSKQSVVVSKDDTILLHGTFQVEIEGHKYEVTLFLARSLSSDHSVDYPYVIFDYHKPGLTIQLGVIISQDTLMPIRFLCDNDPKVYLPSIAKQLRVAEHVRRMVPALLKIKGLKTYATILHHSLISWPVKEYDLVCAERCWYCKERCNHCLAPASFSYNTELPGVPKMKFCSSACQSIYLTNTPHQLVPESFKDSPHQFVLKSDISLPLRTGGYSFSNMAVYRGDGSKPFPRRAFYVVYRHRTPFQQHFMEYFLLDDCSFSHPLPYYSEEDRLEMLLMNDIQLIQLVLQKDLEKLKVKNLTELPNVLSATSSQ